MKFDIGKIFNIKEKNKKNIVLGGLVLVIAVFITTDLLKLKLIEGAVDGGGETEEDGGREGGGGVGQDNTHSLETSNVDDNADTMTDILSTLREHLSDNMFEDIQKKITDLTSEQEQKECSESELTRWKNSCNNERNNWNAIKDKADTTTKDYYITRKEFYKCTMGLDYYKNFMISGYYTLEAEKKVRKRKNEFDVLKQEVIQKRDYLDTINDYYNSLQGEPHKPFNNKFEKDNVDMRQSYYEDEKVDELQWWSNLLTIVFFIIFAILAVYLLGFQKLYKDKKTWVILVACVLYFFFFVNLLIPVLTAIKFVAVKVLPTDIYDKINID